MTWSVRILRALSGLIALVLAFSGLAAAAAVVTFFTTLEDLPSIPEPLRRIIETPPTEIYAANGERVFQVGGRDYVPLEQVSVVFLQAILSTEDHRFWEHHGINKMRILKALWITFSGNRVQGASTITQQLSKNLFFSFEQTFGRKFKELLIALQIESQFSKQEILEAYVNQIYINPRVQGVGAAARLYFGKTAAQLDLAEAALLAGLPKSPTRYNPLRYFDRAKARQRVVLQRMVEAGFITEQEASAAESESLSLNKQGGGGSTGGYFVDYVFKYLEERYGAQVAYHGGLKVTTTLDPQLQYAAQESVSQGLSELEKILRSTPAKDDLDRVEKPQAALVAVQVNTGAIKAMVGGRDYTESEFNRAVGNNRLPGSGFKPFVYYTAFDQLELSPASVLEDRPVRIPVAGAPAWRPHNFRRVYQGPVILKKALIESINTIAAQLVAQTGPEEVIRTAHSCGIQSPLSPVYSVALGTSGVSPLEMASSFATFASGGIHYAPFAVWRVEDAYGQVLEEQLVSGDKVLESRTTYQLVDMLTDVVDEGTGNIVRRIGFNKPAAGKTGTTNGYKDAWFTGFTPILSASVWVGYDQGEGLRDINGVGITGARGAGPIWTHFMVKATEGEPSRPFLQPAGILFKTVNASTGEPTFPYDPKGVRVAIKE